jgi:outer membrane protein OmpA-like peptidoglycan-associated protein
VDYHIDQPQESRVRRLTSIFVSLAVGAGTLSLSPSVASANPGQATTKFTATVAPSVVPNAAILGMARLNKTNSFLVVGIDSTTAGANIHLWKMKEDLTIDASFKPVDLGNDFEYPTASNSSCIANNNQSNNLSSCYRIEALTVNEIANTYAIAFRRSLTASNITSDVSTIAIGNLTTGAVTGKSNFFPTMSASQDPTSAFTSYGATDIVGNVCSTGFGSSYQNIPLFSSSMDMFTITIRPDSSIIVGARCTYSQVTGSGQNQSITDYITAGFFALKTSNGAFVRDNSWGTNGVMKTFDDPTKCTQPSSGVAPDASITSNTSEKIFSVVNMSTFPRVTTHPYTQGLASYSGCLTSGMPNYTGSTLIAFKANGTVSASTTFNERLSIARWIIDSKGRWNNTVVKGVGSSATTSLFRLNAKGEPDTTLGANGQKVLANLPATVTVNGASVNMRYFFMGVASTATGTLFTGFTTTSTAPNSFNCSQPVNYEQTLYPYYVNLESGLVTTYGTNGLGEGVTTQFSSADVCGSGTSSIGFVNSKGQLASLEVTRAIGTQTAGLKYAVWNAAAGVTSGGDGSGVIGGGSTAGRVDKKVYSTRLPAATQADSALTVLTAKQADDLDIRTSTPKICVALTTSVLLVNPGRCVVRIIDEDTKKVLRTMTTTVKATDVDAGTTLTTDEPIYFKQANVKLSKTALAQVKELAAAAASASRIVVIGHSAALGEVSQYSYAISRNRAEAVKAALIKAGVKKPIEVVALAYNQPEKTAKTEAAQAKNRRAEVFIFP